MLYAFLCAPVALLLLLVSPSMLPTLFVVWLPIVSLFAFTKKVYKSALLPFNPLEFPICNAFRDLHNPIRDGFEGFVPILNFHLSKSAHQQFFSFVFRFFFPSMPPPSLPWLSTEISGLQNTTQ